MALMRFPNLETLCQALTLELVPTASHAAPTPVGYDSSGAIWLPGPAVIPDDDLASLYRLGVQLHESGPVLLDQQVCCWAELIPLRPERPTAQPTRELPVIFELDDAAELPALVAEIQRLGSGELAFRWSEAEDDSRVWLRVDGAPFFSLQRAGTSRTLRVYGEVAPRVWIEVGFEHPAADRIQPPAGQIACVRYPRCWTWIAEAPFRPEVREFPTGCELSRSTASRSGLRHAVSLRLIPDRGPDDAELWVLADRSAEHPRDWLRDEDADLLAPLQFAMIERAGRQTLVLRAVSPRGQPPALVPDAVAYRAHLKLPNLFVPCGRRLSPPLRRDAVRQLLGSDENEITWLVPLAEGQFEVQSVPASSFRPLSEWVEYEVDRVPVALEPWNGSQLFEFDSSFGVHEEEGAVDLRHLRSPQPARSRQPGLLARIKAWFGGLFVPRPSLRKRKAEPEPEPEVVPSDEQTIIQAVRTFLQIRTARPEPPTEPPRPTEGTQQRAALEQQFLNVRGPLDSPERQALWPQLASLYGSLGSRADAAVCWINTLWDMEAIAPLWAWGWFRAETGTRIVARDELVRLLASNKPADVRALAAYVVWSIAGEARPSDDPTVAVQSPARIAVEENLGRIRLRLEQQEHLLPVRAAWLVWFSVAQICRGDVLGLVRVRDRLLERLYQGGLTAENDLPSFLRFAGAGAGDRFRTIREWLLHLRDPIRRWIQRRKADGPGADPLFTGAYADLALGWGLGRLGEIHACKELVEKAQVVLGAHLDDVHAFLLEAYDYRIRQAVESKIDRSTLPEDVLGRLDPMDADARFKVNSFRHRSRILEPFERVDPFEGTVKRRFFDNLGPKLAALWHVRDPEKLASLFEQLIQESTRDVSTRAVLPRVLVAALELAPRIGEEFARDVLTRATAVLDAPMATAEHAQLLEKGLGLAALYDQREQVQGFVTRFRRLLRGPCDAGTAEAFDTLAGQCFRELRKLGLREEIDQLLRQMAEWVLQRQDIRSLRHRMGGDVPAALRVLLHVAAGWFLFEEEERAMAVLDEARAVLFQYRLGAREETDLACGYAACLGQAPVSVALERLEELFQRLEPIQALLATNSHASLPQLDVVEAVVRAVVSDDFALGTTVRRWLEEDEYLVRRRIHHDVRVLMAQTGI